MADSSARSRLKVEIGADIAQAEFSIRSLTKIVQDFRKEAGKKSDVSLLPNFQLLQEQVRAGIKPVMELRAQMAATIRQAKESIATATDQKDIEKNQELIARTVTASRQLVQIQKQIKAEAASKASANYLQTLELQAKAGIVPISRLRDEIVKTVRASIANKANRADFINDDDILRNITRLQQLKREIGNTAPAVESLSARLGRVGGALQQAFLPLAGTTAGLALSLHNFSTAGETFDQQLRLISTISKDSRGSLQALGNQIEETAAQLQTDPVDLAAAQYEILSSGITNSAQAFDVLTESAKLAKAGVSTNAEAADLLTSSLNALGGTPARNAEILFKAVDLGKVKISELGAEFGGVASQAAIAGVSLEEISASVATLSLTGQNAAEGLTGIRAILTAVSKQSDESVKAANQLGIQFNTAAIRAKGFAGFIADIAKKTKGSDEAIAKLFGRVEGINTVLSLGTTQAGRYSEILGEVRNSTGSLNEAFERTKSPIQGFIASLKSIQAEAGAKLNLSLGGPITKLTALLNAFRNNDAAVEFAVGATTATTAVASLALGIATVTGGVKSLTPAVQLLANALKIELAAGLGLVGAGMAAFIIAAGLYAQYVGKMQSITDLSERSLEDLNKELNSATDALVDASRTAIGSAKAYDQLAKKINKTTAEQALLDKSFKDLQKTFPNFAGSLDAVTNGYRSMEEAVRNAAAAQIAFDERAKLDGELQRIREAQQEIIHNNQIMNASGAARGVVGPQSNLFSKQLKELQTQEAFTVAKYNDLPRIIAEKVKAAYAAVGKGAGAANPSNPLGSDADAEKVVNARESLLKEIEKIEVEQTGFQQGEIAKRRAQEDKAYADQVRLIKKTAADAKKAGTPEVIAALDVAAKNHLAKLKEIDRDEAKVAAATQQRLKDLNTGIQEIDAQATVGNPFDDLLAEAQKAQNAIEKTRDEGIQALSDLASRDPSKRGDYYNAQLKLIQETYAKEKQATQKIYIAKRDAEIENLNDIRKQTQVIRAAISGDRIAAEKADTALQIAELQTRLKLEENLLTDAEADPNLKSNNSGIRDNALAGLALLKAQAQKTAAEIDQVQAQSAARQVQIQEESAKAVVDSLTEQINLLGQRPELVQALVAANEDYITQLKAEAALTSTTADRRKEIEQAILNIRTSDAALTTGGDRLSQALDQIANQKFSNGSLGGAITALATNIKNARVEYAKFAAAAKQNGTQGGLASFIFEASGEQKINFANIASEAVDAFAVAFGKSDNKFAKAFSNVIGVITAAKNNPALAAISAPLMGLQAAANETGGFLKKYAAFIDPLGFRKLFGRGSKSALQKAQENLEKAQKFTTNILSSVDNNDLASLTKALSDVLRYKSGGGAAFEVKKSAAQQLQAAINDRKKVIDQAIKDMTFQNSALEKAFQKSDSTPLANLTIDRTIALDSLVADRDRQLEQFKDSLEAQALIEKNFQLNRQALYKQSAQDIIDAVIEEQNTIANYRAETAVNEAKVSGNQIAIINANLQAQLVAINNEIAAFKGAEEEKTEFLKEKTSERNSIIKDANDQVNALFRQGLDIMNEGLVVGETKAQSQSRRLKDLFGTLNPLGLIQDNGNLLQTNVTIGSGGIQINLSAIADAQGLISQLQDPTVQAHLLAALNTALART